MTYAQFVQAFQPVVEAFDAKKFPTVVLERIHTKCDGLTPLQMRDLCHEIIDRCEHAPKAHKVGEIANLIRARSKVGLNEKQIEIVSLCSFCDDLSVIVAKSTDNTHQTLMLCECVIDGDPKSWDLPKWTREWAPLYSKQRCPSDWFNPKFIELNEQGEMPLRAINNLRDLWRARIKIAQAFWAEQKKASGEP